MRGVVFQGAPCIIGYKKTFKEKSMTHAGACDLSKKVFIKTYGCQMNVYDSTRMTDVLVAAGYQTAATPDEADLVILNTCHIREKASEKVFSELGRLHKIQKQRPQKPLRLAVAGCVAQAEGDEIQRRAPYVSLVFGVWVAV